MRRRRWKRRMMIMMMMLASSVTASVTATVLPLANRYRALTLETPFLSV